jgi:hypothetical protein
LLWNLLEYARKNVTREFDFGKGEEAYKGRFTNYSRETFSLFIERPGPLGEMRGLLREAEGRVHLGVRNLERSVKEHRPAFHIVRVVQTRLTEALRDARKVKNNKTLIKHSISRAAQFFYRAVRRQRGFDVFVSDAVAVLNEEQSGIATPSEGVSIKVGRLGDLVDVALECPDLLSLSRLQECRQRLKRGYRVYIVLEHSRVALLSWVIADTPTNGLSKPEGAASCDKPAMLMDECVASSNLDGPASYRQLLAFLKLEAANKKSELIVYCPASQSVLRSELQRQGFLRRG